MLLYKKNYKDKIAMIFTVKRFTMLTGTKTQLSEKCQHKCAVIFLSISLNMCFGC